ncbi:translation initiation factor IF-2 [Equus caballus]|uniref:translation initiation factor IF-2 n=1 Tax=Equus caballus TaxID=9796 RepID=UPI0038B3D21D
MAHSRFSPRLRKELLRQGRRCGSHRSAGRAPGAVGGRTEGRQTARPPGGSPRSRGRPAPVKAARLLRGCLRPRAGGPLPPHGLPGARRAAGPLPPHGLPGRGARRAPSLPTASRGRGARWAPSLPTASRGPAAPSLPTASRGRGARRAPSLPTASRGAAAPSLPTASRRRGGSLPPHGLPGARRAAGLLPPHGLPRAGGSLPPHGLPGARRAVGPLPPTASRGRGGPPPSPRPPGTRRAAGSLPPHGLPGRGALRACGLGLDVGAGTAWQGSHSVAARSLRAGPSVQSRAAAGAAWGAWHRSAGGGEPGGATAARWTGGSPGSAQRGRKEEHQIVGCPAWLYTVLEQRAFISRDKNISFTTVRRGLAATASRWSAGQWSQGEHSRGKECPETPSAKKLTDIGIRRIFSSEHDIFWESVRKFFQEELIPRHADYSDLQGVRTNARKDGSDWLVNGSKVFIANGWLSDVVIVVAVTDREARSPAHGISLFLVENGMKRFIKG